MAVLRQFHQVVVCHENQRIHLRLHLLQAFVGQTLLAAALKTERLRDDADGQRAEVMGNLGDDRSRARSRAAAEAGRDKDEVGACHGVADFFCRIESRLFAEGDVAARAASFRQVFANLQRLHAGFGHARQLLGICIDGNQIDVEVFMTAHAHEYAVAAAADTKYLDFYFWLYD